MDVHEVDLSDKIAVKVGPVLLRSGLSRGDDNWRLINVSISNEDGSVGPITVLRQVSPDRYEPHP